MSNTMTHRILTAMLAGACGLAVLVPGYASASEPSLLWTLASRWGRNVDKTKVEAGASQAERDVCTVFSKDLCQPGEESTEPGGFYYPRSVAVAPNGDVYVAEGAGRRVQVFTPTGEFAFMFGFEVNKRGGNLCTKAEESECQAGQAGTGLSGQLDGASAMAIDQSTGNVYVLEEPAWGQRVEELTSTGGFVLMIGKEVNKKGGNLCTQAEESECKAGVTGTSQGAFEALVAGGLLAVGPTDHLLYVGDKGRVQQFESSGKWVGEVPTHTAGAYVVALAVDDNGDLFVAESQSTNLTYSTQFLPGVHEFRAGVLQSCVIDSSSTTVQALAIDAYGRLALVEGLSESYWSGARPHAVLYKTAGSECGEKVGGSEFGPLMDEIGLRPSLAFNVSEPGEPLNDRAYVHARLQEIGEYDPVLFVEARTVPAQGVGTTGATLHGEINPNGLSTRGVFVYGTEEGKLTSHTATVFEGKQNTRQSVSTDVTGLVPNQRYWYATAAEAEVNSEQKTAYAPEVMFHTSTPAPDVPGVPDASFVTGQSAVLAAMVNPEHAPTRYHFEYGPCGKLEGCSAIHTTEDQESSVYKPIETIHEATELEPYTTYSYRLVADNTLEYEGKSEGGRTTGQEGTFTTLPIVPQATTGSFSGVTATGAVISGQVNPEGAPASYAFELGIYNPTEGTQYGIVQSGYAGEGRVPVEEELQLAGLQSGTTYAYRIKIESADGTSYGQPLRFTTRGLPAVIPMPAVLNMVVMPPIPFPKEAGHVATRKLTRAEKLKNALKACVRKHKQQQRLACERNARHRYGPTPKKKGKARKK